MADQVSQQLSESEIEILKGLSDADVGPEGK